jgi:hypothetical protein
LSPAPTARQPRLPGSSFPYRSEYNDHRTHSSLADQTPTEFRLGLKTNEDPEDASKRVHGGRMAFADAGKTGKDRGKDIRRFPRRLHSPVEQPARIGTVHGRHEIRENKVEGLGIGDQG